MIQRGRQINIRLRLIIIKDGKMLLFYLSKGDYYFPVGGHLEFGETIEEGCKREIKEECGNEIEFKFKKILYIRDFLWPEKDEQNVELFILGDINKTDGIEHRPDPEHGGAGWPTWVDINKIPDNFLPKQLVSILQRDYKDGFARQGVYLGKIS